MDLLGCSQYSKTLWAKGHADPRGQARPCVGWHEGAVLYGDDTSYHFHFGTGDSLVVEDTRITSSRFFARMGKGAVGPVVTETLAAWQYLDRGRRLGSSPKDIEGMCMFDPVRRLPTRALFAVVNGDVKCTGTRTTQPNRRRASRYLP